MWSFCFAGRKCGAWYYGGTGSFARSWCSAKAALVFFFFLLLLWRLTLSCGTLFVFTCFLVLLSSLANVCCLEMQCSVAQVRFKLCALCMYGFVFYARDVVTGKKREPGLPIDRSGICNVRAGEIANPFLLLSQCRASLKNIEQRIVKGQERK